MCGRTCQALPCEELVSRAQSDASAVPPPQEWRDAYKPKQNVAPGADVAVVVCGAKPELRMMRWGLVSSNNPPDHKPDWWRQFNARSETLEQLKARPTCTAATDTAAWTLSAPSSSP